MIPPTLCTWRECYVNEYNAKAWEPDDENTRLIANLSQQRRKIVDGQTKLRQQLRALLKSYFPVV